MPVLIPRSPLKKKIVVVEYPSSMDKEHVHIAPSVPLVRASEQRNMLIKVYGVAVLLVDIVVLVFQCLSAISTGLFELFVPPKEKSVEGEVVLITGTGHGIGRELALKFARLGSTVACLDINEAGNAETVQIIEEKTGTKAYPYKCDVSNREEVFAVVAKIREDIGPVTVLVNNAGIMPCRPLLKHNPEEIRKVFDINVIAHFWMLEAVLPSMVRTNHGHVVALSSMAGVVGLTNLVPYCASKFAVRGIMEAISQQHRLGVRKNQVKFTTICPYMVDTGLCKNPRVRFPSVLSLLKPEDVAEEIVRAMRRNYNEISIPRGLLSFNAVFRVFPEKVAMLVKDVLDSGVEESE